MTEKIVRKSTEILGPIGWHSGASFRLAPALHIAITKCLCFPLLKQQI